MKLTAHVIPAKPSASDPLGQRGFAALIWEADKTLIEFDAALDDTGTAAFIALNVAADTFREVVKGDGRSRLQVLRALVEHGRRLIEQAESEAAVR